jgi:hypothetical protein
MNTPITPKNMIAMKFQKNSSFFTEILTINQCRITMELSVQNAIIIKTYSSRTAIILFTSFRNHQLQNPM